MNTDYKLTKFLVKANNTTQYNLANQMTNEIETFDRNYHSKTFSIQDISRTCQNKTFYINKNTQQQKYFGSMTGNYLDDGETYIGHRNGYKTKEVNPYTGLPVYVGFMEEEDLKKLSMDEIKKIEKYLSLRQQYYYLKYIHHGWREFGKISISTVDYGNIMLHPAEFLTEEKKAELL